MGCGGCMGRIWLVHNLVGVGRTGLRQYVTRLHTHLARFSLRRGQDSFGNLASGVGAPGTQMDRTSVAAQTGGIRCRSIVSRFSSELRLSLMSSPVDPRGSGLRRTSTKSKHMKPITKLSAALLAAVMLTANLTSAGPTDRATIEWERGTVGLVEGGFAVPCLNETLLIVLELPYMIHRVVTPQGGYRSLFKLLPGAPGQEGYIVLIGEDSGTVYYSQSGTPAFHEVIHLEPGVVWRGRSHERYVSDDGQRLTIDWHVRFTINANGELVVDYELLDCRIK
jgi:hypothetical protein